MWEGLKPLTIHPNGYLLCPHCGLGMLHQDLVDVYRRNNEDDAHGIHIVTDGPSVTIDSDAEDGNPSNRRDGMELWFECEFCTEEAVMLVIHQHKGSEFIGWRHASI